MKTQKKLALILASLMLAANFASCAKKKAVPDTPDKKDSEVVDVVDDKKTDNKKTDDTKTDDTNKNSGKGTRLRGRNPSRRPNRSPKRP